MASLPGRNEKRQHMEKRPAALGWRAVDPKKLGVVDDQRAG